jgi:putative addiction module component (TIGR02574 family)
MPIPAIDVDSLTPDEQLDLVEQLWDRLSLRPEALPLSDELQRELDARSAELDQDLAEGKPAGIPWQEVLRRIRAR